MILNLTEPRYSIKLAVADSGGDVELRVEKEPVIALSVSTVVQVSNGQGETNVFIQQTDPALQTPYVWFETRQDGTLKSIWVNT
jgi:ApbE superfamily uncharacterized protein (UPF0280 family)